MELKEEKVASLNREIEDLNFTGKTEEEIATLKKAKHDLEMRIKDQVCCSLLLSGQRNKECDRCSVGF